MIKSSLKVIRNKLKDRGKKSARGRALLVSISAQYIPEPNFCNFLNTSIHNKKGKVVILPKICIQKAWG